MSTPNGSASRQLYFERERGVYDVQVARGLAHVVVGVGSDSGRQTRVSKAFHTLAGECVPIFLIKLHRTAVSFAVESELVPRVEACVRGIGLECTARADLALVTVVATSMRDLTGVMVAIADSLQRAGARLYGVGDSHNSVQCLIEGANADAAAEQLRVTFRLDAPHA